jgi:hypothetical protein
VAAYAPEQMDGATLVFAATGDGAMDRDDRRRMRARGIYPPMPLTSPGIAIS